MIRITKPFSLSPVFLIYSLMKLISRPLFAALALFTVSATSQAAIVVDLAARTLADHLGAPVPSGTLIQLVNLGANGAFDQVLLNDGAVDPLTQWVTGDDSVINFAFIDPTQGPDTTTFTTGGFDLAWGADMAGRLLRSMQIQDDAIPVGSKVGIRWFPGLLATDFATTTLQPGQRYGQFTRQTATLYTPTDLWLWPANGDTTAFDPLRTTDNAGGLDPIVSGHATEIVIIPEPGSLSLAFLAAVGLLGFKRRRL
jgi:hypothetical protein